MELVKDQKFWGEKYNIYKRGLKWCGKCGEIREANKKNRCEECGVLLRGKAKARNRKR